MLYSVLLVDNLLPSKFDEACVTNSLIFEVANHVLNFLSGINTNMDTLDSMPEINYISDKECKSLQYLAVFILHKLHSKLRYAKNGKVFKTNNMCPFCKLVKLNMMLLKHS